MNICGKDMSLGMFLAKASSEVYNKMKIRFSKLIPDDIYIRRKFKRILGKSIDLDNPMGFNEKINWIKLYDRNPMYTALADKWTVREHVANKIGQEYLVPLLGQWDSTTKIDFEDLPDRFVLKCTHDSASVCVCKDKSIFDVNAAIRKLNNSLRKNYYWYSREWVYKDGKPRVIAEEYLEDESGEELKDYKIFCFNGEPKVIQVDFGRFTKHERNMYTPQWDIIELTYNYPSNHNHIITKPAKLEEMLGLARTLSEGIPFVRADFYLVYDKIYFGEMTFYPEAGYGKFSPDSWDDIFGSWLELPSKIR